MKIGTCHMMHWLQGRTQEQVLHECVERMQLAEELGYYSSYTTEHHFANDSDYRPWGIPQAHYPAYDLASDPLTFLTYVAAKTTRLRLGTAVLVPHYDHPLRVAERAALLDALSGGRLELGIGRGGGHREVTAFHVPDEGNRDKYHEAIDIMLKAWTGEPFTYDGRFFQVPEVAVVPKPVQQPHPPLYMGSGSQETLTIAARRGLGYCSVAGSWGPVGLDQHRAARDLYFQAAAAAGKDASRLLFPHVLLMYCGESDAEAAQVAEQYAVEFSLLVEAHYERQIHGSHIQRFTADTKLEDLHALAKQQVELNIVGSPETCVRKLRAFRQIVDLNYLLAFVDFGGIPHAQVLASMRRFAKEVLPRFADEDQLATRSAAA